MAHRLPEEFGHGPAARAAATGRFITKEQQKAEEDAQALERIRERHEVGERARASIRAKLDVIHNHFRQTCARDPARLAAYELLYGRDAPGDVENSAGEGVKAGHLPPPLNYIIAGVATEAEVREVFGPEREGENDEAD